MTEDRATSTSTRHLLTIFGVGAAGSLTDGQLLRRFATSAGDPSELAFAALVDRHGPMVLRVARSARVDEPSAHDAFQATFLILAKKARSLWVRDSLGPWLHAVAYRVANQSRRQEGRRRIRERLAARPEGYRPQEGSRLDLARVIHEEIERLPHPYRVAVVTCHLEGLTQQEAADRLGWPVGTVQSRLARGRRTLRDRLRKRGLAPPLGALALKLPPVPPALIASTARLAGSVTIGGPVAGMIAPGVLAMIETTTKGMLMTKLKLGALAVVILGGIVGTGVGLGRAVLATVPGVEIAPPPVAPSETRSRKTPNQDDQDAPSGEPILSNMIPTKPKPWETVVRIKLKLSDEEWGFGSGTVISSSFDESIILTSGHLFKLKDHPQPVPEDFRVPILVDLFGGQFASQNPARLACVQEDVQGQVIDYDMTHDVGLIRIRLARKLPVARLVPLSWQPNKGMAMTTVGCSHGQDATAWSTTILDPRVELRNSSTRKAFLTIKCAYQPKEGREGGGLYTPDGDVAGVCLFADPNEPVGLYAVPEAIYRILDRNDLAAVYRDQSIGNSKRSNLADSKGSRLLPGQTFVEAVDIHGSKYPAPAALLDAGRSQPSNPATPAPIPAPPVSDQDRRIDDLERKLDRILKALETPKANESSDRRMPDQPNLKR